jgi:uncharacterized membrane protein
LSYLIKELLYIYLLSLIPSFEGRYAIVVGDVMGLNPFLVLVTATLGVTTLSIVLPLILPLIDNIALKLSESRSRILRSAANLYMRYVSRIRRKSEKHIRKYGYLGLILFVAVPLPGTGVWTGSLAAYLFGMNKKKTIISLFIGGLLSNIITFIPTYFGRALHY